MRHALLIAAPLLLVACGAAPQPETSALDFDYEGYDDYPVQVSGTVLDSYRGGAAAGATVCSSGPGASCTTSDALGQYSIAAARGWFDGTDDVIALTVTGDGILPSLHTAVTDARTFRQDLQAVHPQTVRSAATSLDRRASDEHGQVLVLAFAYWDRLEGLAIDSGDDQGSTTYLGAGGYSPGRFGMSDRGQAVVINSDPGQANLRAHDAGETRSCIADSGVEDGDSNSYRVPVLPGHVSVLDLYCL